MSNTNLISLMKADLLPRTALSIYIFVCSWSGILYFNSRPLHFYALLLSMAAFYLVYFRAGAKFPTRLFFGGDVLILVALVWLTLNTVFFPNEKSIAYLSAYFYIFGLGYLVLKPLLFKALSINGFLRLNSYAVILVAIIAVVEFILAMSASIDVHQYLPRVKPAPATYLGIFSRSYGLSSEPTILALYFNTLGPLALYYVVYLSNARSVTKVAAALLLVCGLVVTFSASGYVLFAFSALLVMLFKYGRKVCQLVGNRMASSSGITFSPCALVTFATLSAMSVVVTIIITYNPNTINKVGWALTPIYNKIILTNSVSASARVERWIVSLSEIQQSPLFGLGLGYYSANDRASSINWYLFLAAETGILTVIMFLTFLVMAFVKILRSNVQMKYFYLFGFVAATGHFATISTIQNPFLWLLLSVFFVDQARSRIPDDNIVSSARLDTPL